MNKKLSTIMNIKLKVNIFQRTSTWKKI